MKVLEDYQKAVGSQNDKANRRLRFVSELREFVNQHAGIVLAIKADYSKELATVTDEEAGLNFEAGASSDLSVVERKILAGIEEYEKSMVRILKLLPVNDLNDG